MVVQILSQAVNQLSQGDVFGVADQVQDASQRLQAILKSSELQKMPHGLAPSQVLDRVAQQLSQIEPQFNNLSSKAQIKKATADHLFAVQNVVQWLNRLPMWQVPLANQGQYP